MAELFYKNNIKKLISYFIVFLLGFLFAKSDFRFFKAKDRTLITISGKSITTRDVNQTLTDNERRGNSLEYKKQRALGLIRNLVLEDLAAKVGLSVADFSKKIKSEITAQNNDQISEPELNQFLKERNFDRSKLSSSQLENIIANIKEHKREAYFNDYLNKAMSSLKIDWANLDDQ